MSGSECYESIKSNFKDCWDEINEVISDGAVEISPEQSVPVEIFLGGDYKVILLRKKILIIFKNINQNII